jgi:hypothetical protein
MYVPCNYSFPEVLWNGVKHMLHFNIPTVRFMESIYLNLNLRLNVPQKK